MKQNAAKGRGSARAVASENITLLEGRRLFSYAVQTVASFVPLPNGGKPLTNVVVDGKGDLFGTTSTGGAYGMGTVFEVPAGTSTIRTLLTFTGANGSDPEGSLATDASGRIFGSTSAGGSASNGVIFEIDPSAATAAVASSFPAGLKAGALGLVAGSTGPLYGVSSSGVFEYTPESNTLAVLVSFSTQSITPGAITSAPGGNLFITTETNGYSTYSTVDEITPDGTTLQPVYTASSYGVRLGALVTDSSGDLLGVMSGTTETTLFELDNGTWNYHPLTTLNPTNIGEDWASLSIDTAGDLFGVAGAASTETLFELPVGQSAAVVRAQWAASQEAASPVLDGSGDLFTAVAGTTSDPQGVVLEVPAGATSAEVVASFASTNGGTPSGYRTTAMVEDANGNLYGLTNSGGVYGYGTVYELPKGSDTPITLASLQDVSGEAGCDQLAIDASGDLFGVAEGVENSLSPFDYGGIFELPAGSSQVHVVTTLNGSNGYDPRGQPVFDSAGDLFFTTCDGGNNDYGDIDELPRGASQVKVLANFNFTDGEEPSGGMVIDSSGDLFGTCSGGGPLWYDGQLWELPAGASTPIDLYTFNFGASSGSEPYDGLVADANGMLYGTTTGTVYKFDPKAKKLTVLAQLGSSTLGSQSDAPMVVDSAGNVFGDFIYGPSNSSGGQVFEIVGGATVVPLATLPAAGDPSGLVLDPSGILYGTQQSGGTAGAGDLFSLTPPDHLAFTQWPASATAGVSLTSPIQVTVESATGASVSSSAAVTLSIVSGPAGGSIVGNATAAASAGVASFSNLSFSVPGTYVLTARAGGVLAGTSNSLNVVAAAPNGGSVAGTVSGGPTAGVTVFLDANGDGVVDGTELSATTNSTGAFSFSNVPIGSYVLRQLLPGGYTQTSPANGAGIALTVGAGSVLSNENFTDSASASTAPLTGAVIGTTGSYQNDGNTAAKAFDGNLATFFDAPTAGTASSPNWVGLDLGSTYAITAIKYASRSGWASRMNGGLFQASNDPTFASGVVTLYTIASNANPSSTSLTSQAVSTSGAGYRYVRYLAPAGSYGDVAEVQFFGTAAAAPVQPPPPTGPTGSKLSGTVIGTTGSYQNDGNTAAKAFDGNLSTFFDAPTAGTASNPNWVGLDLGQAYTLTQLAYASRSGWAGRMDGGIFQASNDPTFATGVVNLYTIASNANPSSTSLTSQTITTTGSYRYVRYLSPAGSYGDVAEVQFFGTPATTPPPTTPPTTPHTLTGTAIGTSGSYQNDGNTLAKVFDGNLSTFFDGPSASGDWVGLDLGAAHTITSISYAPRSGWASRMVGGIFQASNTADFSSGVVNLYTVTATPATGSLTTVSITNTGSYRYVRYLAPANSYGNIAEIQLVGV